MFSPINALRLGPDRWTPHLAYHDGTACATTGPYLYALMGENLLIYDTENDAVAFVAQAVPSW